MITPVIAALIWGAAMGVLNLSWFILAGVDVVLAAVCLWLNRDMVKGKPDRSGVADINPMAALLGFAAFSAVAIALSSATYFLAKALIHI